MSIKLVITSTGRPVVLCTWGFAATRRDIPWVALLQLSPTSQPWCVTTSQLKDFQLEERSIWLYLRHSMLFYYEHTVQGHVALPHKLWKASEISRKETTSDSTVSELMRGFICFVSLEFWMPRCEAQRYLLYFKI